MAAGTVGRREAEWLVRHGRLAPSHYNMPSFRPYIHVIPYCGTRSTIYITGYSARIDFVPEAGDEPI